MTYSIGPHGRGCARARGATIGRGARGRRTRKNARAPRKGRLPSRATAGGGNSGARSCGRGGTRPRAPPVVRVAVEAGVEAGVAASVHALPCRPHATPQALPEYSRTVGGLPPLDLHLVKGASAFAPALLSAETAAPHRAAPLRHGSRGDHGYCMMHLLTPAPSIPRAVGPDPRFQWRRPCILTSIRTA